MQSCTLSRDLGVPRLARTRFASSFGEHAAPFGLAPASQSVGDTVQRLREREQFDLAALEASLHRQLRPIEPIRPSAETTKRIEWACLGTALAIGLLVVSRTAGWLP
ncbi:hypothetical protein KCP91_08275 [Microvirga sp. SRT01]|uniref:Uncharacterized protein n=1 Tax=Sphingomonas longa TaxID=2778730 RepID=A0ABS2D622_9SPHN|nr:MULTISPECIES: hypothetical protein [Alphaproteobacteria]MBM6576367.1 hypothetical protein [Sphingomonas sp. BT552]MBR7709413.1 hypothetical protein [Microvirga sp. SRT01]